MGRTIKTKIKRFASLLLAVVMLVSLMPAVLANPAENFSDFPTGWSKPAMEAAVNNGLLVGVGDGKIGPQQYLTRAEMAAVMVRAFGATTYTDISGYTDVDPSKWYYSSIASAVKMGALSGISTNQMAPESYITREQVFTVLARLLALSGDNYEVVAKFNDAWDISNWALTSVIALVERGYVSGDNMGRINPKAPITREEFAQLMYLTIEQYITAPGVYENVNMDGIVVIRVGNVTLRNVYVEGDLVVGDGAAKNEVILENVTVNGRLLTRGGTNTLTNSTVNYGVVVLNPNGITMFKNYGTEPVFAGLIQHTMAGFLSSGGIVSVGGGSGQTKKYTVTFKLFEDDGDSYDKVTVTRGSEIGRKMPDDPHVDGYTFNGWVDEKGKSVTSKTRVYDDMLVIADLTPIQPGETIEVTFYEGYGALAPTIGDVVELTLNDKGEASVAVSDIPDISGYSWVAYKKSDYMKPDYEDYNGVLRVRPSLWYYKGGEWKAFDETTVLTEDTDVHLMYKQLAFGGFDTAIKTRYNIDTRLMDSAVSFSHDAVVQLEAAKDSGLSIYEKLTSGILDILEGKDLIDDEKYIKMLHIPLQLSNALNERQIKDVVEDSIEQILTTSSLLDKLFLWPGAMEYLVDNTPIILPTGLTDEQIQTAIKNYIGGLTNNQKITLAADVCEAIYDTVEYKNIVKAIVNNKKFVITEDNLKIMKEILDELRIISFDTVLDLANNSAINKLVDVVGYAECEDIFDTGRDKYCDDLAVLVEKVETGTSSSETIESAFDLVFDPIEDVLKPLYSEATYKAIAKLQAMDIYYDENPYLKYLVEGNDVIDELFEYAGNATEEHTAYKLKDATDYAAYMVELLIATNDALCWYGEELTDEEFDAVYETVFAKIYAVNDRLDDILKNFYYNDELPQSIEAVLSNVKKINNIFLKFESTFKNIIGKYLESSIYEELVNGTLGDKDKVHTAIDILIGQDDPVFTIDCLYDIFYQYDDRMQEKLNDLIDSGKFDKAIDKFKASRVGQKLGDDAIDDIVEIVENVAANGIDSYLVDTSSDVTIIDRYEITIGGKTLTLTRSFMF